MKKLLSTMLLYTSFAIIASEAKPTPDTQAKEAPKTQSSFNPDRIFSDGKRLCQVDTKNKLAKCIELSPEQQQIFAEFSEKKDMLDNKRQETLSQAILHYLTGISFLKEMNDRIDQKVEVDSFDLSTQKSNQLDKFEPLDQYMEMTKAGLRALEQFKLDNPDKETELIEKEIARKKAIIQEEAKNKALDENVATAADIEKAL